LVLRTECVRILTATKATVCHAWSHPNCGIAGTFSANGTRGKKAIYCKSNNSEREET